MESPTCLIRHTPATMPPANPPRIEKLPLKGCSVARIDVPSFAASMMAAGAVR